MIPDALANALLMGVNPIYGLHALMVGTPLGSLVSGSEFMTINATGAMSVATGGVLAAFSSEQQAPALVTLTILVGLFQVLLGLFRWDGFLRFVSNAVLTGFMNGIAVTIVLGQLGRLTGYNSAAGNRITQTLDLVLHLNQVDIATTVIGLGAIALILILARSRLKQFNLVLASSMPVPIFCKPPYLIPILPIALSSSSACADEMNWVARLSNCWNAMPVNWVLATVS